MNSRLLSTLLGGCISMFSSLGFTLLCGLFFRLPVPNIGYIGSFGWADSSLPLTATLELSSMSWLYYGSSGGFFIVLLLGMCSGYWLHQVSQDEEERNHRKIILTSGLLGVIPILILALFIGVSQAK